MSGIFLLANFIVSAAPGDLDPTFNGTGRVVTPIGIGNEVASAVLVQPDGKIVAAGDTFGPTRDFALVRYNSDGTLDSSFDSDGKVTTDFNNSFDTGNAAALQGDSKILVVGNSLGSSVDYALARYNPNGSLDSSFGTGGKVTTDIISGSSDTAYAVAVQADGKIVAAGISDNSGGSHTQISVARYNQNGSLDNTFGSSGRFTFTFGPDGNIAEAVVIQPDGKIVLAGSSYNTFSGDFAIARLNTNGSLDSSFDGDGKVTIDFEIADRGHALAIQPDGKLVVAGHASAGSSPFAVARLNANGSLDTSFDGDGKVTTDFGGVDQIAEGVAVQPDGKIVAGGSFSGASSSFVALARYTATGTLDSTFGAGGKVTFQFNNNYSQVQAIAIQPDWKIVVAGNAFNGANIDFAAARLQSDSVHLSQATYSADENSGSGTVTVTRTGDVSSAIEVNYGTADTAGLQSCHTINGKASERCDYVTSFGTLRFAANEISKTISIPLIDDVTVEGNETFTITLSGPGAPVGTPASAVITIVDNDTTVPTSNPIDGVEFFVRQQYLDILGRQPDQSGFQNWVNTLSGCPNGGFGEPPTSNCDRLHVAAGFFQSDEFLNRGYWAFRFYMVSYQQRPTYSQFVPDMAQVGGPKSPAEEEAAKTVFADAFVQSSAFAARYSGLSGQALANALTTNAALPPFTVTGGMTNGQILRAIAERQSTLDKFLTEGTVSILYFGFQRRDPDTLGYQNNIDTLNANPNNLRHMIFIFIYSTEYRQRFGPA